MPKNNAKNRLRFFVAMQTIRLAEGREPSELYLDMIRKLKAEIEEWKLRKGQRSE